MAFIFTSFVLSFLSIFQSGSCLQCYTCNQRVQNAYACLTYSIEDCTIRYPQSLTTCTRTIQISYDGLPPWVVSQCSPLGLPTDPLLNQCQLQQIKGANNIVLYTLEICACTTDLCNSGSAFGGSPALPQPYPVVPQAPPVPPPVPPPFPPPFPPPQPQPQVGTGSAVILPPPAPFPVAPGPAGLMCYKCNQRYQNTLTCRNPIVENCATSLPGQQAVCARRIQTFANGEPPWVFAQCEPRLGPIAADASPLGGQILSDTCRTALGRSQDNQTDSIETCVCSNSLCNSEALNITSRPGTGALRCYQCNERLTNGTACSNRTTEDCSQQFPGQPVACVRSVQTFSDGQAPWVIERCQIRALFPEARPFECWSQPLTGGGGANGTDLLEFCTCISDLCNTEAIMSSRLNQAVSQIVG